MCLPPPLVQPFIINHHPQPRVASDPRNIRPLTYDNRTQVQNKTPRHRLENAGILKARPVQIYDTSIKKEVPQPRVDAINRETSKRRLLPATIYPTDQDCRGHVEKIRPRPSYLVRRKHDESEDGWKRHNQGWRQVQIKGVPKRWTIGRQYLEGNIRWDDKNWTSGITTREKREINISCKGVMIRPLAGSAQRHGDDVVGHERIHADHDGRANSAPERRATDRKDRTDRTFPTNLI